MKIKSKYGFGDKLKDRITGYTGTVMAVAFYDTGCTHYGILPSKIKSDGDLPECQWLDETRLLPVKMNEAMKPKEEKGGPFPNPPGM